MRALNESSSKLSLMSANRTPIVVPISPKEAMKQAYRRALKAATDFGYHKESPEALLHGAAISAFLSIASGMLDQGCV